VLIPNRTRVIIEAHYETPPASSRYLRYASLVGPSFNRSSMIKALKCLFIMQMVILSLFIIRAHTMYAYLPWIHHLYSVHDIDPKETYCIWLDGHTRPQAHVFAGIIARNLQNGESWNGMPSKDRVQFVNDKSNDEYNLCDDYEDRTQILLEMKFVSNYPKSGFAELFNPIDGSNHNGMIDRRRALITLLVLLI
jgi:hypothetical protein